MIRKLVIEGFKSIKSRVELPLRALTVLAGANSSGKSSAMQPLLLLKQTFEEAYDPGPLQMAGPNVAFSLAEQMFWRAPGGDEAGEMTFGVYVSRGRPTSGVEVTFHRTRGRLPVGVARCKWVTHGREAVLEPSTGVEQLSSFLPQALPDLLRDLFGGVELAHEQMKVTRNRSFLVASAILRLKGPHSQEVSIPLLPQFGSPGSDIEPALKHVIHVPGLRGNPRRTYPVSAVGVEFPGVFHEYAASVIAEWASSDQGKLAQLGSDLQSLGLTWKVTSQPVTDTQVEIRVGRLLQGRRGGSRDLVSVADVGFGLVQVLPVAVALLVCDQSHTVYLEQPEIHLHPRAQVALAELIARAVARGSQVVVETHSELLLLGIQRLVGEGHLDSRKVLLHWFSRDRHGATSVATAELDRSGTFGDWPADFSETSMAAMRAYLSAAAPE